MSVSHDTCINGCQRVWVIKVLLLAYREAIRLTSPRAGIGLYTNLGALLMGSGRIDACLTALQTGIALAHEHKLTDSNLVQLLNSQPY